MVFTDLNIDWEKLGGMVPAIVQHADSGEVLMLGYMTPDALLRTIDEQRVTFYSRSRQKLWQKGETSGHWLHLDSISVDCDSDSLLVLARPEGPTCHRGTSSCFDTQNVRPLILILSELESTLQKRKALSSEATESKSYTMKLFREGVQRMAQKVGEEGVETALAAVSDSDEQLISESADLLFHLLVLLQARNLSVTSVLQELRNRRSP